MELINVVEDNINVTQEVITFMKTNKNIMYLTVYRNDLG